MVAAPDSGLAVVVVGFVCVEVDLFKEPAQRGKLAKTAGGRKRLGIAYFCS